MAMLRILSSREQSWGSVSAFSWADCSKRPSSKAAGESKPEAYTLGYVEDFDEPRTLLADFFNSLLELVLRHAVPECIAGDLEKPACFGNVAACALQRFL